MACFLHYDYNVNSFCYNSGVLYATTVMDRVNAGESFADLARELSTCPSKDKGGELVCMRASFQNICLWLCKLIRQQHNL
jgi:hypothetical protein